MRWEDKPEGSIESIQWSTLSSLWSTLGQAISWMDRDQSFLCLLREVESSDDLAWNAAARAWELAYSEEDDPEYSHPYDSALLAIAYALASARRQEPFRLVCEAVRAIGQRARMAFYLVDGLDPPGLTEADRMDLEAHSAAYGWKWIHTSRPTIGFVKTGTLVQPDYELKDGVDWGKGDVQWRNPIIPRYSEGPVLVETLMSALATRLGAADFRIEGGPGLWKAAYCLPSSQRIWGSGKTISEAVTSAAAAAGQSGAGGQPS